MEELAAAELDVQVLLRRLCRSISTAEVISARADPDIINQLQPQLKDIALSVLLGLHPVRKCWGSRQWPSICCKGL